MPVDLRLVNENELSDFVVALRRGFGRQFDPANFETYRPAFASAQALAAYEDGKIVGTTLYNLLEMYAPGGMLPTALLDHVTVQPTHRRQGILTQMMTWLMNDLHEREVTLSVLGASESVIYGRFGYGPASMQVDYTLERQHANFSHFPDVTGSLRFIDKAEARKLCPIITERACRERPGYLRGTDEQWDLYIADPVTSREGASGFFMVVYEEAGEPQGYVNYRVQDRKVIVHDLMPVTSEAHAALWQFCFGIDLMDSTYAPKRPVDDSLPWMLADPRRLHQSVRDDLWLRLVDVRQAMAQRTYAREGSLIIDVVDEFCQWNQGRFKIDGSPDGSECERTTSEPDLVMTASDLAAGYLGAISFTNLSIAGRAEERTGGALTKADAMFHSPQAPWWPNEF